MGLIRQNLVKMLQSTVWNFHDFSIIQILREINFRKSRGAKSAILTLLETLKFDLCKFLPFVKAENDQKSKFRVSKIAKNGIFRTSQVSKIDFTQNLKDRKLWKFPHCEILVPLIFYVKSYLGILEALNFDV